ncbi:uncharacterized protein BDV17DRAFT_285646 [Aspergillus undulatus]|uniref:uncharacterized protein n=1 Tax=Aspergillus undulatus TaxID=1810928 RepID=UPI003CCDE63B
MEQLVPSKKQRRARAPKSYTGCRTCRTRHLKCDEAPGACKRCTAAGFKCDGYDAERLSHKRAHHDVTSMALTDFRFRSLLPDKTAEERRFFSRFHTFTIPMMSGWLVQHLWSSLVVRMSQSEPALCHAVVALSALQEASETAGKPVLIEDMTNRTHRFALYQYNLSIERLTLRMKSKDPLLRNTVLLCCLIFIAIELVRGKFDKAIAHLTNGLQVLGARPHDYHALYRTHPALEHDVEHSLAAAVMHLDLQSAHFGLSPTHITLDIATLSQEQGSWPTTMNFDTIEAASLARDRLFLHNSMFAAFCDTLSAADIAANYSVLWSEQRKQQVQVWHFGQALDALEETITQRRALTPKDRISLDILRLHQSGIGIVIDTSLIKSEDLIRDAYASRFSAVIDLAESITAAMHENARKTVQGLHPTLMMDTAVIGPLYYTIDKCCNPMIAERALRVLESWPHREGIWDSTLAARLAGRAMRVHQPTEASSIAKGANVSLEADYILVGGGTAGLVLASRLDGEPDTSVVFLEAGNHVLQDPRFTVPSHGQHLWTRTQTGS